MPHSTNQPATDPRPTRMIPADQACIEPLYPATRLLAREQVEAQRLYDEARQALAAAQDEAKQIVAKAHAEADEVRREGFEQAKQELRAQFETVLRRLDEQVEQLRGRYAADVRDAAFRFARAILHAEFATNPQRVADLVATVLPKARLYRQISVHLHPQDVELVRPFEKDLLTHVPFANTIAFKPDPKMERHGVRVETEMGNYEATIDSRAEQLAEHLRGKGGE